MCLHWRVHSSLAFNSDGFVKNSSVPVVSFIRSLLPVAILSLSKPHKSIAWANLGNKKVDECCLVEDIWDRVVITWL